MACLATAFSKNTIDLQFAPIKLHVEPEKLRAGLQEIIDTTEASSEDYDAIVLGFGLCGNGTSGLKSEKFKMVIPRTHDCCALTLGSSEAFVENFEHRLSAEWSSHGFAERDDDGFADTDMHKSMGYDMSYADMVEKYGEENAQYVWETLHPVMPDMPHIYIEVDGFENNGLFERFKEKAAEKDAENGCHKEIETLTGSMRLFTKLLDGDWDDEFLIVEPGKEIEPNYDLLRVFV
jgi:hypothetical protein